MYTFKKILILRFGHTELSKLFGRVGFNETIHGNVFDNTDLATPSQLKWNQDEHFLLNPLQIILQLSTCISKRVYQAK